MRRRAIIIGALLLVGVGVAVTAAARTTAAEGQELTFALVPCIPVGAATAGGEAEWKGDTQILKGEMWGATDLAGRTLDVFADVLRDGVRVRLLLGSLTIDREGDATYLLPGTDADLATGDAVAIGDELTGQWIFSSDRALC